MPPNIPSRQTITEIEHTSPALYFNESGEIAPTGCFCFQVRDGILYLERASSGYWDSADVIFSVPVAGGNTLLTMPTGRGATLVVAARNSSAVSKAQADYLCVGVADDVTIQAALDALPVLGGKVLLMEGTYVLAASIAMGTGETLEGLDRAAVTLDASALSAVYAITAEDDTMVKGLTVSGGDEGGININGDHNVRVLNTGWDTIKDAGNNWAPAIHITGVGSFDIIIDDVYIFDCDRGIEVENCGFVKSGMSEPIRIS